MLGSGAGNGEGVSPSLADWSGERRELILIGVLLGVLGGAAAPQTVGEVGNF